MAEAPDAVTRAWRQDWGRLLSLLVTRSRRLDLAEDGLGEAFARAAERWPRDGVPDNPAGWLYTTAWRWMVDRLRAEAVARRTMPKLAVRGDWQGDPADGVDHLGDDRLQLMLLCCHPALAPDARAALALRLVVGTLTDEIARLFLVSRPTMAARITRAKRKIVAAGIPLTRPAADELDTRLDHVCRTVYLAFTAGYTPGTGADLLRADLAGDAVELSALLHRLVPTAPQARALVALLMLHHARRDARVEAGRLVLLADQDRSRWHHDEIETARALLGELEPASGHAESLRLQALIAVQHARAATASATDWPAIAAYYRRLEELTGSPVVRLNRAVAVAEVDGPARGLALLDDLDDLLPASHRLAAVRAEFLAALGRTDEARRQWQLAVERCGNEVERAHLAARAARG